MEPTNADYRQFTDRLMAIYYEARRVQRDRRLSAAGREQKVVLLDDAIVDLCGAMWMAELPPGEGPEDLRATAELIRRAPCTGVAIPVKASRGFSSPWINS